MYITPISMPFGSKSLKLRISKNTEKNKGNILLYNKTLNIINQYRLPAKIENNLIEIEFTEPKFQYYLIKNTTRAMKNAAVFYEKVK